MKLSAKALLLATMISFSFTAHAEDKMKMNFINEDITKIVEQYSKASGKRFIIDATVRGKATLLNANDVTLEDAYNQLSIALALNGFAIIKQGENSVIRNARSAQRDGIEVVNELPAANPERMITWVITLKNAAASDIQREVRMLTSSYGEIVATERTNQLIISDWSGNLQRVSEVIKRLDVMVDPATAKIAAASKKERSERMARKDKEPKGPKDAAQRFVPANEKESN